MSAPQELRDELEAQPSTAALVAYYSELAVDDKRMTDPLQATRAALRAVAARVRHLDAEVVEADKRLRPAVAKPAPTLGGQSTLIRARRAPSQFRDLGLFRRDADQARR